MFASKDVFLTPPSTGGYTIARSVRFRSSAQGYFSKTLTTPTNNKKWTYSVWMKRGSLSANRTIMSSNVDGAEYWDMRFNTSDQILIQNRVGSSNLLLANTTAVYRDPSAWYHIVFAFDSANATAANRNLLYVNGVNVALSANSGSSDASAWNTSGVQHNIGVSRTLTSGGGIWAEYDGYETEINFIDGQALTPSSFGSTNAITGVWQPAKYTGTYGTNGFYLNFSDNSNNTATTIGKDYSGNGNNWTPNNISVTAGATYDSMTDVPTVGATSSNYCVLNPLVTPATTTIVDGNLGLSGYTAYSSETGTIGVSSGKWYFEFVAQLNAISGITGTPNGSYYPGQAANAYAWDSASTQKYNNNTGASYGAATSAGDIVGVAYDLDGGSITFYKNNVSQGTAYTFTPSGTYFPVVRNGSATNTAINFGQRPFTYTPPTGFVALNTYNLPASTITNGAAYMAATLYTGTGASLAVSNAVNSVSFQPDFVWIKDRSNARNNSLLNSITGTSNILFSDLTNAEQTGTPYLTSFNSNGFTAGPTYANVNGSGETYVGWQWKAGTTSSSNTNGSITSSVSANTTAGFSVVTYTLNNSTFTVGHGLGVAPSMILVKDRDTTNNWDVYHVSVGAGYRLILNDTSAQSASSQVWNNTAPTSTVFSGNSAWWSNPSTSKMVAYCFAPVAGYSAFGSYTGNGSTDGPFVYTGFRPRFILIKRSDITGDWIIYDSSRDTYNVAGAQLFPDTSGAENTAASIDFVSNGFKLRIATFNPNSNGNTFIYAAFAENPFKNALAR